MVVGERGLPAGNRIHRGGSLIRSVARSRWIVSLHRPRLGRYCHLVSRRASKPALWKSEHPEYRSGTGGERPTAGE